MLLKFSSSISIWGFVKHREEEKCKGDLGSSCSLYEAKSLPNNIFIKRELCALRMTGSTSVTKHVNSLNTLFSQLTSLSCIIEPHERAEDLLKSLPDSYDRLIINLTTNVFSSYLAFDEVAAVILEEENRCNKREDRQTSSRQLKALVVTRERGHFKKDCRGLNTLYPQGNVASTLEDGNDLCCEAAIANEGKKRFADITGIRSIMVKMHDGTVRTIGDVRNVEGLKAIVTHSKQRHKTRKL
ncbi:hypothetical protein Tco_1047937 [Tanacetum coccineum]